MNLIGKAADPQFWAEIKNKPEFKPMLEALKRDFENDGMDEIPTTKFSKFRLFHDIGDLPTRSALVCWQIHFFRAATAFSYS